MNRRQMDQTVQTLSNELDRQEEAIYEQVKVSGEVRRVILWDEIRAIAKLRLGLELLTLEILKGR